MNFKYGAEQLLKNGQRGYFFLAFLHLLFDFIEDVLTVFDVSGTCCENTAQMIIIFLDLAPLVLEKRFEHSGGSLEL